MCTVHVWYSVVYMRLVGRRTHVIMLGPTEKAAFFLLTTTGYCVCVPPGPSLPICDSEYVSLHASQIQDTPL